MADHDSKSKQVTIPPSAADVGAAEAADRAATDPPAVTDKPTSILAALKESTAATEATVEAIRKNTGETATETSKVVEALKEQAVAAATPAPGAPLPAKPAAAVADITGVIRAGEGITPAAAKASALTVADIYAAKRKNAINLIWEITQAYCAIVVVTTTAGGVVAMRLSASGGSFPAEWWTIVGLIVGFYYGRTNHARGTPTDPSGAGHATVLQGQRE